MALDLKEKGLSDAAIAREIERTEGERIDQSQISDWVLGKHYPQGRVRQFREDPSPELAYVIGVRLGDATIAVSRYNFHVKLRVTDYDFALEFSRCLCKVLHRPLYEPRWSKRFNHWHVAASSILLYKYLSGPLDVFKEVIEHDDACASAFLEGFFDSEGSYSSGGLTVSNTNLEVLNYSRKLLLERFSVETTGPYLGSKGGRKVNTKGKVCNANKDAYYVRVRALSFETFDAKVGFSIGRKSAKLSDGFGRRGYNNSRPIYRSFRLV